ncbi:hypothetical protein [Pseudomonas sp. FSL R10-1339]|uniref:hypothetical protein n=1 Tax=Pseudomonas sp. FSL R10-1339 TaxID=2662196 RepID=UPI001294ABA2|nr:hypothetical protein [Pseudomonas sp. FSL R10-1339]MQU55620.1 hypothetical protein [Pseudomonas sp. FSL R10-1339]
MDEKIAHLGFIQGTINRMGSNAFLIKGWTLALIAALLAISPDKITLNYLIITLTPVVLFGWLDTYYLHQEKLFIELYREVAQNNTTNFSMDTQTVRAHTPPMWKVSLSVSILPFYLLICSLLAILYCRS